ncbi:MAG: hypothetical protein LKF36_08875 [Lactobacillus sp.]|jgi:uncharacterized membrane protein|nr:hypothetical protein [Lactobacillus sp.]
MKNAKKQKANFQKQQAAQQKTNAAEKRRAKRYQIYRDILGTISFLMLAFIGISFFVPSWRAAAAGPVVQLIILAVLLIIVGIVIYIEKRMPHQFDTARAQNKLFVPKAYGVGITVNPHNPLGILFYVLIAILFLVSVFWL